MSERQRLKQIFTSIYSKVRSIQNNNYFDKAVEREASKTYIGASDNFFFQQLCDVIFQSGVRGAVWLKYEPEIRKEFVNYNVRKVARYTKKDIERMLHNAKMFKNRRKIEACVFNAKQIVKISKEYNGFSHFLECHEIGDLIEKLKGNFKFLGYTNAYAWLRYVGVGCLKPDVNVVRVLFRLGLINNDKRTPETYKQIQEIGKAMSETNGVKMAVIDYTLYMFGAGEKQFVKYAVCGKVPKCNECPVKEYCITKE